MISAVGEHDEPLARELGATPVWYGAGLAGRVRALGAVDAVFDAAGQGVLADAIALAGGPKRVITLSDPAAADFGVTLSEPTPDRAPGALDQTIALLADGRLRLRAHQSMPMQQAADAHRRLRKARFVLGTGDHVDSRQKVVSWSGPEGASGQAGYDRLILTAGSVNRLLPIPGVAAYAHGFRSIAEAIYLRDHTTRQLEPAEVATDPHERAARCTFVVIGLDSVVAAALPTAGGTGLALVASLEPLAGKTVLIVGAGGGVGSFATQFAVNADARVIANVRAAAAGRMRGYGAAETVDHTEVALPGALRQAHPDGIDVLIDLVSDADGFAALAALVRPGGTAVTTKYVADPGALAAAGVTGTNFNFAQYVSGELLEQVADALVGGRIAAPPITRITLEQAPAALNPAQAGRADGKPAAPMARPSSRCEPTSQDGQRRAPHTLMPTTKEDRGATGKGAVGGE